MTDSGIDVNHLVVGDLRLDRPVADDVVALHAIYRDPRVWTHLPSGRHIRPAQTEQLLQRWIDCWQRDGFGPWVVRCGAQIIGHGGCTTVADTFWNLGYRFHPQVHGRGYATQVAGRGVQHAALVRPDLPVVAYLLEHNLASARVAAKVGLTLQHRAPDAGNPDPAAIRLVYADRPLTDAQVQATLR